MHSPILRAATLLCFKSGDNIFFYPNNHYLLLDSSLQPAHFLFSHQNPPKLSSVCERSAHYSKPAAKHFPGRRRRRRMALVSPCPLGDVPHPTSIQKLTLKITKSVKCENPDSCCAPSAKECFSLLSFPPLPTTHPTLGELLPPSTSIQGNQGFYLIFRQKKKRTKLEKFPLILKLNHSVSINYSTAFRIFSPLGGALSLHQAPHYVALHNMLRTRYMDFV